MRRIPVFLFVILLTCSLLVGCGVKEKIGEQVTEKIVEKMAEEALGGGKADVDMDGDKITIKDNQGGSFTLGMSSWPDVDYIPEFKDGSIIAASVDGDGNMMVMLEKVELKALEDYWARIKRDFPEENLEVQNAEYVYFEGKSAKGE